jgi:hypothetical protein
MGRPTDYRAEYCERVVELMSEGWSKAEVAAEMCRSYQTFLNWQQAHPEFLEAVKLGEKASQAWWERLGREGAAGSKPVNPTLYIFNMKNRFRSEWNDKTEVAQTVEHSGAVKLEPGDAYLRMLNGG